MSTERTLESHGMGSDRASVGIRPAAARGPGITRQDVASAGAQSWPLLVILVAGALLGLLRVPVTSVEPVSTAIDVATVLALAFAATLMWPRNAYASRVDDGVVCAGLGSLAVGYAVALVLQVLFHRASGSRFVAIAPAGELACGIAMLMAARVPPHHWLAPNGKVRLLVTLTVMIAAFILIAAVMPVGTLAAWSHGQAAVRLGTAGTSLASLLISIPAGGLLAVAALRIRPRGGRSLGGVTAWLAFALMLLAAAAFGRLLPVPLNSRSISPDVLLRLCAAAVALAAVLRRESALQAQTARRAALAERRRVARDLHDGIAQDLAFIASHGSRVGELGEAMASAARRALMLTRNIIDDLSDLDGMQTWEALEVLAQELEDRFGMDVRASVDRTIEIAPEMVDDLFRIVREAVVNASRHGSAKNVLISLSREGANVILRVIDDGSGFGSEDVVHGFGLASVRDRVAAMGGQFKLAAAETGGVELVVVWS